MRKTGKTHTNEVILVAFDRNGDVVEEQTISYEDYYEGLPEVIDSNQYRASKGITRVTGRLYGRNGTVDQDFDNQYSETGQYVRSRIVHGDGTVIED